MNMKTKRTSRKIVTSAKSKKTGSKRDANEQDVPPYSLQRSEADRLEALRLLAAASVMMKPHPIAGKRVECRVPRRGVGEALLPGGPAARCTYREWDEAVSAFLHGGTERSEPSEPELDGRSARALFDASTAEPWSAGTLVEELGKNVRGTDSCVPGDVEIALNAHGELVAVEQGRDGWVRVRPVGSFLRGVGILPVQVAFNENLDYVPAFADEGADVVAAAERKGAYDAA
jgi:hypothetical protein